MTFPGEEETDITDIEKEVFALIDEDNEDGALEIFKNNKDVVRVQCRDKHGMNLLSMACYRGLKKLVVELLHEGADPNLNDHRYGYSSLMFAGISSKPEGADICRILLDAGADADKINSIGKTASQMASFLGKPERSAVINSHIGLNEIHKIVYPGGKRPRNSEIPVEFVYLVHASTKTHNIHPVKIVFFLFKNISMVFHQKKFLAIVDELFEKQIRSTSPNEVMSIKLWLILSILRLAVKFVDVNIERKAISRLLQIYARHLLKMNPEELFRAKIESLLRHVINAFPYRQSLLFQTLHKAISETKFGDSPGAYFFIVQALFGHQMAARSNFCSTCGVVDSKKRCANCRMVYCSSFCQLFDWRVHQKCCSALAARLSCENEPELSEDVELIDMEKKDLNPLDLNKSFDLIFPSFEDVIENNHNVE